MLVSAAASGEKRAKAVEKTPTIKLKAESLYETRRIALFDSFFIVLKIV